MSSGKVSEGVTVLCENIIWKKYFLHLSSLPGFLMTGFLIGAWQPSELNYWSLALLLPFQHTEDLSTMTAGLWQEKCHVFIHLNENVSGPAHQRQWLGLSDVVRRPEEAGRSSGRSPDVHPQAAAQRTRHLPPNSSMEELHGESLLIKNQMTLTKIVLVSLILYVSRLSSSSKCALRRWV